MCERKITGSAVSERKHPSSTAKNFWIWCIMIVQTITLDRRHFFLIIDDYNRHTVIYLLEKKNYILGCNKKYTPTVENEFGRKPKIIHSDRGGVVLNRTVAKKNRSLMKVLRCES